MYLYTFVIKKKVNVMTSDNNYLKPKYVKYLLHDLMKICRSLNPTILVFPSMINCPNIAQELHHYRLLYLLWRRTIANRTVTNVATMILTIIHFLDAVYGVANCIFFPARMRQIWNKSNGVWACVCWFVFIFDANAIIRHTYIITIGIGAHSQY